jgi:hypothetical protein
MTGLLRERHRGQTNQGSFCWTLWSSTQQTKALTDAIFVGMTADQWSEYDNRHARILEILRGDGQVQGWEFLNLIVVVWAGTPQMQPVSLAK